MNYNKALEAAIREGCKSGFRVGCMYPDCDATCVMSVAMPIGIRAFLLRAEASEGMQKAGWAAAGETLAAPWRAMSRELAEEFSTPVDQPGDTER